MQNDVEWQHDELQMLANNFMDVVLREANAAFLVAMLGVVDRTAVLHGLERLMEEDGGLCCWENRAVIFEELLQRWPNDVEESEMAGVVRLCCSWTGRWPWDERPARLLVEKLCEQEMEVVNRIFPEEEYRAVGKALGETSNRYGLFFVGMESNAFHFYLKLLERYL